MKNYFYFICFVFLFLSGCDTFQVISQKVSYNEKMSDLDCVKNAINKTDGVSFEQQTNHRSTCVALCDDDPISNATVSYKVIGTKENVSGVVQILKYKNKPTEIKNYTGRLNRSFLAEDKPIIQNAVDGVSAALEKNCTVVASEDK